MRLPSESTNFYWHSHYVNALNIEKVSVVMVYTSDNEPTTKLDGVIYIRDTETEGEAFELLQRIRAGKHFKKGVINFKRRNIGLPKDKRNKKGDYKVAAYIYLSYDDAKIIGGRARVTERVRNYVRAFLFGVGKASYSTLEGARGLAQKQIDNKEYEEKKKMA